MKRKRTEYNLPWPLFIGRTIAIAFFNAALWGVALALILAALWRLA